MPTQSLKQKRKEEALELAQIVFDVFMEDVANGTINNGQNNTNNDNTD